MNKRQFKKAFKKEHGYNPRTMKNIFKWVSVMGTILNDFENVVRQAIRDLEKGIEESKKRIRSMPDEEFVKFLDELTPNQKIMAYKWRGEIDE